MIENVGHFVLASLCSCTLPTQKKMKERKHSRFLREKTEVQEKKAPRKCQESKTKYTEVIYCAQDLVMLIYFQLVLNLLYVFTHIQQKSFNGVGANV